MAPSRTKREHLEHVARKVNGYDCALQHYMTESTEPIPNGARVEMAKAQHHLRLARAALQSRATEITT